MKLEFICYNISFDYFIKMILSGNKYFHKKNLSKEKSKKENLKT